MNTYNITRRAALVVLLALLGAGIPGCLDSHHIQNYYYGDVGPVPEEATALLLPMGGGEAGGTVVFTEDQGFVRVEVDVSGLAPGKYLVRIHERGDARVRQGGGTPGPVFNPRRVPSNRAEQQRGHLGIVEAGADGKAEARWEAYELYMHGPETIIGRAVGITAVSDDPTSGEHQALGIIGMSRIASDDEQ